MVKDREISNVAASVRTRLLNIARSCNHDFEAVLLQYFQERFLYRLSQTIYRKRFILKGALVFLVYDISRNRPTKDIDFLSRLSAGESELQPFKDILTHIAKVIVDDGVRFDPSSMKIERIAEGTGQVAFRVKLNAYLGTARNTLQLDFGVGDVIVPKIIKTDFPTLLDDQTFVINVYTRESVIAEKFEAIVRFGYMTSRMKDFYDILFLAENTSYQLNVLHKAIDATFKNRGTSLEDRAFVFNSKFKKSPEKQEQWSAFLTRNHLQSHEHFYQVVEHLKAFIDAACCASPRKIENATWEPDEWKWITK